MSAKTSFFKHVKLQFLILIGVSDIVTPLHLASNYKGVENSDMYALITAHKIQSLDIGTNICTNCIIHIIFGSALEVSEVIESE